MDEKCKKQKEINEKNIKDHKEDGYVHTLNI